MRPVIPVALLTLGLGSRSALAHDACVPRAPTQLENSLLIEVAAARLGTSEALVTGAAGSAVARSFVGAVCAPKNVHTALPATCAELPESQVLLALRRRLLVDAVSLPAAWLSQRQATLSRGEQLGAGMGVSLLDAALQDPSLQSLGASLAGRAGGCIPMEDPVIKANLQAIGRLLQALARSAEGAPEEARRALREELARQGRLVGDVVSVSRARAEAELLVLLPALQAGLRSLKELQGQARAERLLAVVVLLGRSLELSATYALDAPAPSVGPFAAVIEALAQGRPSELIPRLGSVLPAGMGLKPQERRALEVLGAGLRLVSARDHRDAQRILREIALGPWSEPWMVDVDGLALSVSNRGTRLGGQLLLGYQTERLGLAVQGRLGSYDLDDGRRIAQTDRASGELDGWLALGSSQLRFDLRLTTEIARYKTTQIDRQAAASEAFFFSETSLLARGLVMPGLRLEPTSTLAFGLWAGAGLQYESHRPVSLGASQGILLDDTQSFSVALRGRLRGQANVWPEVVSLRASVDAVHFRVTTDSLRTSLTVQQGTTQEATGSRGAQTEANARLFVDIDALRFAGFIPALVGGVDTVIYRGDGDDTSAVVPSVGAGVRRTSF